VTQFQEKVIGDAKVATMDMQLEVVVIPVSDVDRAKAFYGSLGWRLEQTACTNTSRARGDQRR
jgi:predicted enzyme related to lactoylglutathione lyase